MLAMTLHHWYYSSVQKKLWCSNARSCQISLKHASLKALSWRGSLRRTGFIPTVSIIIRHPIGCVVGIGCGGEGIRGVCSRRWSSLSVDGGVLVRLILIIGVTEDNDFTVAGRPEDVAVEVVEELAGELLVP
jgi:hypothetical protein